MYASITNPRLARATRRDDNLPPSQRNKQMSKRKIKEGKREGKRVEEEERGKEGRREGGSKEDLTQGDIAPGEDL